MNITANSTESRSSESAPKSGDSALPVITSALVKDKLQMPFMEINQIVSSRLLLFKPHLTPFPQIKSLKGVYSIVESLHKDWKLQELFLLPGAPLVRLNVSIFPLHDKQVVRNLACFVIQDFLLRGSAGSMAQCIFPDISRTGVGLLWRLLQSKDKRCS